MVNSGFGNKCAHILHHPQCNSGITWWNDMNPTVGIMFLIIINIIPTVGFMELHLVMPDMHYVMSKQCAHHFDMTQSNSGITGGNDMNPTVETMFFMIKNISSTVGFMLLPSLASCSMSPLSSYHTTYITISVAHPIMGVMK